MININGRGYTMEEAAQIKRAYEVECTKEYLVDTYEINDDIAYSLARDVRDLMSNSDIPITETQAINIVVVNYTKGVAVQTDPSRLGYGADQYGKQRREKMDGVSVCHEVINADTKSGLCYYEVWLNNNKYLTTAVSVFPSNHDLLARWCFI